MTMISSTNGDACMAAMVCSMIGFPAILISCFGMLSPTLVPVPPASTTATLRNLFTGRPYRPIGVVKESTRDQGERRHPGLQPRQLPAGMRGFTDLAELTRGRVRTDLRR